MGNCLQHQSSMQWAGDDWDFLASEKSAKDMNIEEGQLGGANKLGFTSSSSSATTEVKIKITKKQLKELLGKVDVNELSVQQVLAQLMKVSDHYEMHHRSWKPALQTIPE